MANVSQWTKNAAGNNAAVPDGWPEGMPPSGVNDSARENMAAIKRWFLDTQGSLVSAGTGNDYTLTTNSTNSQLSDQGLLVFKADRDNTGAVTLNVDGLGAKSVVIRGVALSADDIKADTIYAVVYVASLDSYSLINPATTALGTITGIPDGFLEAQTEVTASTTQTQAGATALTSQYVEVDTVANDADAVKLITASTGQSQTIRNEGANALQVFPASGDSINGGAVDAADQDNILPGWQRTYFSVDATSWYRSPESTVRLNFIETRVLDNTTSAEDFTDLTGFDDLIFVFENVLPATDGANLLYRVSNDNGASFISTGYSYLTGGVSTSGAFSVSEVLLGFSIGNVETWEDGLSGEMKIRHARKNKFFRSDVRTQYASSTSEFGGTDVMAGLDNSAGPYDAVRVFTSSGNLSSGTITVIGVTR